MFNKPIANNKTMTVTTDYSKDYEIPIPISFKDRTQRAYWNISNISNDYKKLQYKKYSNTKLTLKKLHTYLQSVFIPKPYRTRILTNYDTFPKLIRFIKKY